MKLNVRRSDFIYWARNTEAGDGLYPVDHLTVTIGRYGIVFYRHTKRWRWRS